MRCQPGIFYLFINLLSVISYRISGKGSRRRFLFLMLNRPSTLRRRSVSSVHIIDKGIVLGKIMHTPPQEYSMTAEGGALVPREWCIHSGEMVHGGRRRGAPSRHAGAYSGRALRLRMDSPSIWIVYAL